MACGFLPSLWSFVGRCGKCCICLFQDEGCAANQLVSITRVMRTSVGKTAGLTGGQCGWGKDPHVCGDDRSVRCPSSLLAVLYPAVWSVGFEQGPGSGELSGVEAWKKGLLVARGCRVQREARGPVVEVSRGRGCRVQFVHSWV